MAWDFPECVFDLDTDKWAFANWRFVRQDGDVVTVEREGKLGLRLITQVRLEDIRCVEVRAPMWEQAGLRDGSSDGRAAAS